MDKKFDYKTVSGTYKIEIHFEVELYEDREVCLNDIIEGYIDGEIWSERLTISNEKVEYYEMDDEEIENDIAEKLQDKGYDV